MTDLFRDRADLMEINRYRSRYDVLTRAMLRYCFEQGGRENTVLSPLSVLLVLAIAADAAAGETRTEILCALEHPGAGKALSILQRMMCEDPAFSCANAVCVRKENAPGVGNAFRKLLEEMYAGELFASDNVADEVSAWIGKKTKGMIRNAGPGEIREAVMCLVNAVAFDASWKEAYETDRIYDQDFHNADGSVSTVKMMYCEVNEYIDTPDFTGFRKTYENSGFSFMALLPKKEDPEALPGLLSGTDFGRAFSWRSFRKVHTGMPEYRFEYSKELTPLCNEFGISRLFSSSADLSPVSRRPLLVGSILHKAFIDVSRTGTRAAAVTILCAEEGIDEEEEKIEEVILDRPFIFTIMHDRTNLPVFTGVVTHL